MTCHHLDSLSVLLKDLNPNTIPPLDAWQPNNIVPFDVVINENGEWYHQGTKMTRQSLVKLFASVLWVKHSFDNKNLDNNTPTDSLTQNTLPLSQTPFFEFDYFLKTPSTLYQITVQEAPLFINRIEVTQEGIVFLTHTDDACLLSEAHLPFFKNFADEMRPYIWVRDMLFAKIGRQAFYHLVNLGTLIEDELGIILRLTSAGKSYDVVWQA